MKCVKTDLGHTYVNQMWDVREDFSYAMEGAKVTAHVYTILHAV